MNATVLIPVKSLTYAKSRLAKFLSKSEREKLVLFMLNHVVKILLESNSQFEIYIVTSDFKIKQHAKSLKIKTIEEKNPGHNRALTYAAKHIDQNYPVLTISADLPFVTGNDIKQFFTLLKNTDIVLAPSKEETGTNAILMKTPLALPYHFGKNSLDKFISSAKKQKLKLQLYEKETIAFDIDTIQDLKKIQLNYSK